MKELEREEGSSRCIRFPTAPREYNSAWAGPEALLSKRRGAKRKFSGVLKALLCTAALGAVASCDEPEVTKQGTSNFAQVATPTDREKPVLLVEAYSPNRAPLPIKLYVPSTQSSDQEIGDDKKPWREVALTRKKKTATLMSIANATEKCEFPVINDCFEYERPPEGCLFQC